MIPSFCADTLIALGSPELGVLREGLRLVVPPHCYVNYISLTVRGCFDLLGLRLYRMIEAGQKIDPVGGKHLGVSPLFYTAVNYPRQLEITGEVAALLLKPIDLDSGIIVAETFNWECVQLGSELSMSLHGKQDLLNIHRASMRRDAGSMRPVEKRKVFF